MLRALAVYTQEEAKQTRIVNGKKETDSVPQFQLVQFAGQNLHEPIVQALRGQYTINSVGFIYFKEDVLIDPKTNTQKPCWLVVVSKNPHLSEDLKLQLAYLFVNMRHVLNRGPIVNATLNDMFLNTPNFIGRDILVANTKAAIAETREIMIRNIEAVLERGEKIENLKERTEAMQTQSLLFKKEAKKLNNCCGGYVPNPWG